MPKKVAIIIERANIMLGGAERSAFELSQALTAKGFDVQLLAATGQANSDAIHVLSKDKHANRVCLSAFEDSLKAHFTRNSYDIIHSFLPLTFADIYQPRGGSYAEAVLRNAASYQSNFMKTYKRITSFANFRRTRLLCAEKEMCKKTDGPVIVALSEYVAEQFQRHYNIRQKRITIIPNGVRTDKPVSTKDAQQLRSQILAKLNLKEADQPALFLFVANNFRLKGLRPLIKAFASVWQTRTSRRPYLVVAGHDKSYKFRHLAKKIGIDKKIVFLGPIRHIQNALSVTDVAVLPTFYDPASRFILEALAADKPVITTRFNGAADLFVNDRHGKIIDTPENIIALTQALRYFTETKNIQQTAQNIIDDNIKEKVSIDRAAEQVTSLYEQLFKERSPKCEM
ncbi:glycosyltransferase family 4 protein [Planctomycetota bacterium]